MHFRKGFRGDYGIKLTPNKFKNLLDRLAILWGKMTFRGNPKIGQSSGCVLCDNQAARPPGSVSVHWLMATNCANPTPLGLGMLPSKKKKARFHWLRQNPGKKSWKNIYNDPEEEEYLLPPPYWGTRQGLPGVWVLQRNLKRERFCRCL